MPEFVSCVGGNHVYIFVDGGDEIGRGGEFVLHVETDSRWRLL
jgi:hypothetical protein